jgi:hypothetical protein
VVTGCQDTDEDGYFVGLGCDQGIPTDCDDGDEFVYPGAPERCNGIDDDCDEFGEVDDNPDESRSGCPPRLGVCEGFPIECVEGQWNCGDPPGYSAEENCDDDLDNNCDGQVNEICECRQQDVGQPCGSSIGECQQGTFICVGEDKVCQGEVTGTEDICDELDNDCDGITDNNYHTPGTYCPYGLGNCQADGHWECAPQLEEGEICVANGTAPNPETEWCNDKNTEDEDCDGSSNEFDTDSCPLTETWAAACVWLYRTTGPTNEVQLCGNTIQIPLNTDPPVVSGFTHEWAVIDQTCPSGFDCYTDFTGDHTLHPTLNVTLIENGMPAGDLSNLTYTATVELTFLQGGLPVGYYQIRATILFCEANLCFGNTACDNTPPSQGGGITATCSSYDG